MWLVALLLGLIHLVVHLVVIVVIVCPASVVFLGIIVTVTGIGAGHVRQIVGMLWRRIDVFLAIGRLVVHG